VRPERVNKWPNSLIVHDDDDKEEEEEENNFDPRLYDY
jgi:hypothetical protein